jgi:hypothetical protein
MTFSIISAVYASTIASHAVDDIENMAELLIALGDELNNPSIIELSRMRLLGSDRTNIKRLHDALAKWLRESAK